MSEQRDNFDDYNNLGEYWIKEDALRSLDYDLYFSLGTRYYCDAGCKVCYIEDNLKKTKSLDNFNNDLTKMEPIWLDLFNYFGVIRTNDDLYYLKHKFPNEYKWYQEHGNMFELCMTDNSIFRTLQLDDIKLAGIGDISVSTDFIKQVGVDKVLTAIKELYNRYGVKKIKYIDCGHPELFKDIIEWNSKLGLHNCVHHDFRTTERNILNHEWAEYQNTWVINDSSGLMQIHRESLHLYYDRFYFSSDDASDINIEPFHYIKDALDIGQFIADMLKGKQVKYTSWKNRPINKKFRDYYKETLNYKINDLFNFIPVVMFPRSARFFYRLEEDGWKQTPYGLFKQTAGNIIPIMEKL
jgi:hypothetical protein